MFWLYFSTVTRLNVGDGNKMEETTLKTAEHDEMIEADLKLCGFLIILPPLSSILHLSDIFWCISLEV